MKHQFLTIISCGLLLFAAGCKKTDEPQQPLTPVTLQCTQPAFLKQGDKVALISPSYFTPMENVEKTADVLRTWGLEPVIGPNVGKVVDGKYAGTVAERASDIRWALADTDIKLYHSMRDDIVAPENTMDMYKLFVQNGVTGAVLDTTSLTGLHTASGTTFAMTLMMQLMMW